MPIVALVFVAHGQDKTPLQCTAVQTIARTQARELTKPVELAMMIATSYVDVKLPTIYETFKSQGVFTSPSIDPEHIYEPRETKTAT